MTSSASSSWNPHGEPKPEQEPEPVRPRMTMRVYEMSRDGTVTRELRRVEVMGDQPLSPMEFIAFPPCRCPRHRGGG